MNSTIYLEWSYTPENYFEEPQLLEKDGYRLEIDAGKAKAILDGKYEHNSELFDKIHKDLEGCFLAVQIFTHRNYSLSSYSLFKEYPDGRKGVNIFVRPAHMSFTTYSPDIKIAKADGTVVTDTKRVRLDDHRLLTELFFKYRSQDPVVEAISNSFGSSVKDPTNAFIYLYEIRDALCARLGGKKNVKEVLGLVDAEWDDFGRLTNKEPVREGRHRGKDHGNLRKATDEELTRARKFAKKMITQYLLYLDKGGIKPPR